MGALPERAGRASTCEPRFCSLKFLPGSLLTGTLYQILPKVRMTGYFVSVSNYGPNGPPWCRNFTRPWRVRQTVCVEWYALGTIWYAAPPTPQRWALVDQLQSSSDQDVDDISTIDEVPGGAVAQTECHGAPSLIHGGSAFSVTRPYLPGTRYALSALPGPPTPTFTPVYWGL